MLRMSQGHLDIRVPRVHPSFMVYIVPKRETKGQTTHYMQTCVSVVQKPYVVGKPAFGMGN